MWCNYPSFCSILVINIKNFRKWSFFWFFDKFWLVKSKWFMFSILNFDWLIKKVIDFIIFLKISISLIRQNTVYRLWIGLTSALDALFQYFVWLPLVFITASIRLVIESNKLLISSLVTSKKAFWASPHLSFLTNGDVDWFFKSTIS